MGQHKGEQASHQAVEPMPPVCRFDDISSMIDEVHVVHPGGAGGHAGEARQAAVNMRGDLGSRWLIALEHLLYEINTAARRIALVPQQHIGWTGGGAEPAMHTGAQDFVRLGDLRVGKLRERKLRLHGDLGFCAWSHAPSYMPTSHAQVTCPITLPPPLVPR